MVCRTWVGHADEPTSETLLNSWTYLGPHLPRPEQPRVHMNLWLMNGEQPENGQATSIVVTDFFFQQYTPPAPPCPADLDNNNVVDGGDLGLLLSQWGRNGSADITNDSIVDGADLGMMLGAWGICNP